MSSLDENKEINNKTNLENELKNIGFTNSEIEEVLSIIEKAEITIQSKLAELNSKKATSEEINLSFTDLKSINNKMNENVRAKIKEIKERKTI